MELVGITAILKRHRVLLVIGAVIAVLVGAKEGGVLGGHTTPPSGQALVHVVVNTRQSLLASQNTSGAETIQQRAALLAATVGSDQSVAAIAKELNVPAAAVAVLAPSLAPQVDFQYSPDGQFPLSAAQGTQSSVAVQPLVIQIVADPTDSGMAIGTYAPTAAYAVKLADAAIDRLQAEANSAGAASTLRVQQVGPIQSVTVTASVIGKRLGGFGIAIGFWFAWCILVVLGAGISRGWREDNAAPTFAD
jgi:hypothetical protein